MDLKRHPPLGDVLVILPRGRMIVDVPIREGAKGLQAFGRASGAALTDGIDALSQGLSGPLRRGASLSQADGCGRTEPHLAALGATAEDKHPPPDTSGIDPQVQAVAIRVPAGCLERCDLPRREALGLPRHLGPNFGPNIGVRLGATPRDTMRRLSVHNGCNFNVLLGKLQPGATT